MSTADLLVEVGTEELPPKALRQLMDEFGTALAAGLDAAHLAHGGVRTFASPRRLAVVVEKLADRQEDRVETQKGPPVAIAFDADGKPKKPATAFAAKWGVALADLGREKTVAGEWLSFTATIAGRAAAELVPGIVQEALDKLPVPRRMRWGDNDASFVRPVHWLVMLHGAEILPATVLGIEAGRVTRGHRFHCQSELTIDTPGNYEALLEKEGHVIPDFDKRRARIVAAVEAAADALSGNAVGDDALYDEVTALTEWPVAVTGAFEEAFLSLPREVIVATLTNHQRYFPVADRNGSLLPAFITLANIESTEPDKVRDGNERVIRPRLQDAAFFWKTDRQTPLGERTEALKNVVYQQGLGSLHDKSMRVAALATLFAKQLDVDGSAATRAAVLAKCDLLSGMVGEFPELQGTMGAYYATESGEPPLVAQAIGEQYLPRFAGDRLPESMEGKLLAVADKLDTLAGIFVSDKKPSGNRDPFGLRRAALGVVRILVEGALDLNLNEAIRASIGQQPRAAKDVGDVFADLSEFVGERMKSYFLSSDERFSSDMFEAVRASNWGSLPDFASRLSAVASFMTLESAVSLAAANKRTANILRQADAADRNTATETLDPALLVDDAERVLYHAMQAAEKDVTPLVRERRYEEALRRLAELRTPVDAFFDDVMVMTDDVALRHNRLALLSGLRSLFLGIGDISRINPVTGE